MKIPIQAGKNKLFVNAKINLNKKEDINTNNNKNSNEENLTKLYKEPLLNVKPSI